MNQTQDMVTRRLVAEFTAWGEPVSKARARVTRTGHAYTPEATRLGEAAVLATYKSSNPVKREFQKTDKYVLEVVFNLGSKRARDADNMVKLVADALNKEAYLDDSQIIELHAYKRNVLKALARTEVSLWLLTVGVDDVGGMS